MHKPAYDGELVPVTIGDVSLIKFSSEDFELTTKSGNFLPRLQLMTANADKCKEGEFPINHYALVRGKSFQDLEMSVDVLVVSWRPKAIEISQDLIIVFDAKSDEFKRIQEKSSQRNSNCMYGPEFLVYIPSIEQWALFFMGSKSARNESNNMQARLQKAATLSSKKIENRKHTWFSPQINSCSTPFDLPSEESIKEQIELFNNPVAIEPEVDESPDSRER